MSGQRRARSVRATLFGLAVNGVLAGFKLAAGVLGHSQALVADGVESLADIFSSLVVWRGLVVASEPADADHPYGHGKAEPIAAAIVSTMLLLAAVGIAVQSLQEVSDRDVGPRPFTLLVLIGVVVVKEGLYRYVSGEAGLLKSSAMQSDAWHHRTDAITSLAAAVGISVALIGGPAYHSADDVAAIVAAGIIAWNGWRLLRPALDELMDTAPPTEFAERVRQIASQVTGVGDVEKCLVRKMGYQFLVDMHVQVDPELPVRRAHEIAHQVKDRVRRELPLVSDVLVHIEPGIRGSESTLLHERAASEGQPLEDASE